MKEQHKKYPSQERPYNEQETLIFAAELGTPVQIDLHQMDAQEATHAVDLFLDAQFMAGEQVAKIIHGRGTGRLREVVHHFLQGHPLVEYYRDAQALHAVGEIG